MYSALQFVLLLYILFKLSNSPTIFPVVVCRSEPFKCCSGYRRIGIGCKECWPGTFGINCNRPCPDGLYGRLCREKCNCSSCNKISGYCQSSSSLAENIYPYSGKETANNNMPWWIILVAVGPVVVGMPLGAIIWKQCSRVNHPNIYFHTLNIQGQNAFEQNTYDALQKNT